MKICNFGRNKLVMKNFTNFILGCLFILTAGKIEAQVINPSLFNQANFTVSPTTVGCQLENGSSTQCYQISFASNPVAYGPFCPETNTETGGLGMYDGSTDPGLRVMNNTLWTDMESDGYDIVDNQGNVRINDPGSGQMPNMQYSYCLEATADNLLQLTFLIPVTPQLLNQPNQIETVELIGVSIDGVPMNGDPPSATSGGPGPGPGGNNALMPALDPCGGHHDPSGYYHWHFVSEAMNSVLSAEGITEVSCANIGQDLSAFVGFAKDGYPIYGPYHNGTLPNNLDQCSGHTSSTDEYPSGVYHYHAVHEGVTNMPPCLIGAAAVNPFTYGFYAVGLEETANKNQVQIYPNPSNGSFIMIENVVDFVRVFDPLGRELFLPNRNANADGKVNLAVRGLPSGIYLIHAISGDQVEVNRFIVP